MTSMRYYISAVGLAVVLLAAVGVMCSCTPAPTCPRCHGTGSVSGPCSVCSGTGRTLTNPHVGTHPVQCVACSGHGTVSMVCPECGGSGKVRR